MRRRAPCPALRPFVRVLWASEEVPGKPHRERVLPTGTTHVVLRLSEHPLRVFADTTDPIGQDFSHAVIGGVRTTAYVRDISRPIRSVGAQLHPGAVPFVLGVPADELAHRHTSLEDVLGAEVRSLRQRLLETPSLETRLRIFESYLAGRLPTVRGVQPVVAHALSRIAQAVDIASIVRESGYSHRAFISLFRRNVGVPPKTYARLHRFALALTHLEHTPKPSWAQIAALAGYSDQAHLSREFRVIADLSPTEHARLAMASLHHVPLPEGQESSRPSRGALVAKEHRSTR